jgi:hypothetical protein
MPHKLEYIYLIPHHNQVNHQLKVVSREEKACDVITANTTMGRVFYYRIAAFRMHTYTRATEQQMMKVDSLTPMIISAS